MANYDILTELKKRGMKMHTCQPIKAVKGIVRLDVISDIVENSILCYKRHSEKWIDGLGYLSIILCDE